MTAYNLTEDQKKLLRSLVGYSREGQLGGSFFVHELPDPERYNAFLCWIDLHGGDKFRFASKRDLDWLCDHDPPLIYRVNKTYSILQAGMDAVDDDFVERILLEPSQEELLVRVVEAVRNKPENPRRRFIVARSHSGDFLIHSGLPEDKREIFYGDVETLAREELLAVGYGSRGDPYFDITPLGYQYYEYLKKRVGDTMSRIESTVRNYLDAYEFQKRYPQAYGKWSAAEELLWQTDTSEQLTTIGHLCREAVQEFAAVLVDRFEPPGVVEDKAKTIARVRAILEMNEQQLGRTEKLFLQALLAYWGAVNDLVQRQEHGAVKEGESLAWEDARRVVFHAGIVMFEIDKAV